MNDDALVKEKTVRALTDRMIAAVNALEFDPSMVGQATDAALSALASAGSADADRVATETARDVALAQVDLFEAPAKAVLDDIMGGNVAGLAPAVAGKTDKASLPVNVKDYGAIGDGTTDDTAAINAALTEAVASKRTLWFPPTPVSSYVQLGYKVTTGIAIPPGLSVTMDGPIRWATPGGGAAITVGDAASRNLFVELTLWVRWSPIVTSGVSSWTDDTDTGIRVYNLESSVLRVTGIRGFTTGIDIIADATGWVHNEVYIGQIYNCRNGLKTMARNGGWFNENSVFGGTWGNQSALKPTLDRHAIVIDSDGSAYLNNANAFYKPALEIGIGVTPGVDFAPIVVRHGSFNSFHDVRHEGSGPVAMRTENLSADNYVSLSVAWAGSSGGGTDVVVADTGSVPSTTLTSRAEEKYTRSTRPVFDIQDIPGKAFPYSTFSTMVPGLNMLVSGTGAITYLSSSLTRADTHLEVSGSGCVGLRVSTLIAKRFVVSRDAVSGNGGRVVVICYDAAGVPVDTSVKPYLLGGPAWSAYGSFGAGGYRTQSDATRSLFNIIDEVKSVFIGVTGGTASAKLRGLSVFTDVTGATTFNVAPHTVYGPVATVIPTLGTHVTGARVFNATPGATGTVGWVCTAGGTPGTWRAF